jgi:hypothetical protein
MAKQWGASCPPHFFILPPPSKEETPIGVCKFCGQRKAHVNYLEISYWRNQKGERPKNVGRKKAKTPDD